ncbi:MAG: helix-turn-helix transcriptional regulator [Candidatus Omnitrophica bacterium]|nr:helix-turn-helix transcriptional regulator [Candidatus Omnitrophota bacterium]
MRGATVLKQPRQQAAMATTLIGKRLRQLRKERKMTLAELARGSGIDTATISRIETGKMTGTLESHMRLTRAMGLTLAEFYAGLEEARQVAEVRTGAAKTDVYVHEAGHSSLAILTKDPLQKKMLPVLVTIEPGGRTQNEEGSPGTEQFLYVLAGPLEARIGKETYALKAGQSLYFDATVPHHVRNTTSKTVKALVLTTPPAL